MHKIKYALFYDFHTTPLHPGVGKNFDAETLTDRFLECGVDYVTFHARCNMGNAYYNTAIGQRHPSLNFDLFGDLAKACDRKGIKIGAYFNAGLSRAEAVAHRDWTTIYPDGSSYHEPFGGPFSQTMCYNTAYGDHLLAMALEVAEKYPVSGFFFDCMSAWSCVCPVCVKKMQEENLDFRKIEDVRKFAFKSRNALAKKLADALKAKNPDYLIYFNDVAFEDQQDMSTYLEFECLPCKSGGYQYMHTQGHYMRTLGKQCVHMNGRFNQWSDFGGLRNAHTLKYELFYALANGARPNIGDHLNPSGEVNEDVFALVKEVYSSLQRYDKWFDSAVPETDAAIVWHNGATVRQNASVSGAIRMLTELKMQFDIVTEKAAWDKYQLLVLPDEVQLSDVMRERIKNHLAKGGKIIASGNSGWDAEKGFPENWPVSFKGDLDFAPAYFKVKDPGVTVNMPLAFYEQGYELIPEANSRVAAVLVRPAITNGWDGIYPEYYNPPWETTDLPFLALTDQVAVFSGRIFKGYAIKAAVQVRDLVAHAFKQIGYTPLVKLTDAPSFLQIYTGKTEDDNLTVSMLSYLPEKRGIEMESCEDELCSGDFTLALKTEKSPAKIYLAPDGEALDFTRNGEYIQVQVPSIKGFGMLVIEF